MLVQGNGMTASEVIGLVPAAGQARRLGPLPCSKEILRVCSWSGDEEQSRRPKAACQYVLESFRMAGVTKAYVVLRAGKWDIPAYLGDGASLGVHLAYLMMRLPFGVPYTLDEAHSFLQDKIVALGFPDIIFEPNDAFVHLLNRLSTTQADVVLGLFPSHRPEKTDMVEFDEDGMVRAIVIKQAHTELRYAWIIAVWTPVFTRFMHEYLAAAIETARPNPDTEDGSADRELFVGNVVQAAMRSGLCVQSCLFPQGRYLDIGTPDDLAKAQRQFK